MESLVFHATVQGYSHQLSGLICQDSSGSVEMPGIGACAFVAADGHGDPACLRSDVGSRAAVEVANACLSEFAKAIAGQEDSLFGEAASGMLDDLRHNVITRWQAWVTAHYAEHPLDQAAWESLSERAQLITRERPAHLYGTTLVAGVLLPHALVLLQQGDGCCVVVHQDGTPSMPVPEDERCVGNMTTSLCDVDASQSMRSAVIDLRQSQLLCCVVGSDGVDKSLYGTSGLYDFVDGLMLDSLTVPAEQLLEPRLLESLNSLSQWGSGDDASLAGFVRPHAVARMAEAVLSRRERFSIEAELAQLRDKHKSMKRLYDRYEQKRATAEEAQRYDGFMEEYHRTVGRMRELERVLDSRPATPQHARIAMATKPRPVIEGVTWRKVEDIAEPRISRTALLRRIVSILIPLAAALVGFLVCLALVMSGVLVKRERDIAPQQVNAATLEGRNTEDSEPMSRLSADGADAEKAPMDVAESMGQGEESAGLRTEEGASPDTNSVDGTASTDEAALADGNVPTDAAAPADGAAMAAEEQEPAWPQGEDEYA